ncbi:MAG: DUF29 domain-containing protein [Bryobacterales bacterium]|nr:DUF29 domain-containing protein [Bryobacterales bacterium]
MAATSMKELAAEAVAEARPRDLYFEDPWSWSREQVAAMQRRDYSAIDWDNVIEEIGDVGRRDEKEWASPCENVVSHLLKIQHDSQSPHVRHWRGEVWEWRRQMHAVLVDSPGVKGKLFELLDKAWRRGRGAALDKLVEGTAGGSGSAEKGVRRALELRLPVERPHHVEDIASYDPFDKDAEPSPDVWPAAVARVLNDTLGTDYPVRERGLERGTGFSR